MQFKAVFAERVLDIPISKMAPGQTGVITSVHIPTETRWIGHVVQWTSVSSKAHLQDLSNPPFAWPGIRPDNAKALKGFRVRILGKTDKLIFDENGKMKVEWGASVDGIIPLSALPPETACVIMEGSKCNAMFYGKIVGRRLKFNEFFLYGSGESFTYNSKEFCSPDQVYVRPLTKNDRIEFVDEPETDKQPDA